MFDSPQAFRKVIAFLEEHQIPYMVIGGLALAIWGEGRATHDADFKVIVETSLDEFRKLVLAHFSERTTSIPAHKKSPYVLQVWAAPGLATDFLVSIFEYEKEAVRRAVTIDVFGTSTRICTAEDLIIHKAIADREKDWLDISTILYRQQEKLDVAYIRYWLEQFATALETPEILNRFDKLYQASKQQRKK